MEVYTLVSMVIGIFGAAYAALNSLRTNVEPKIKSAQENAKIRLEELEKIRGKDNKAVGHCKSHKDTISFWNKAWTLVNILPAVAFFSFITLVTVSALLQWEQITVGHQVDDLAKLKSVGPWCYMWWFVMVNGSLNFLCVLFAIVAWIRCRMADKAIKEHHDGLEHTNPPIEAK